MNSPDSRQSERSDKPAQTDDILPLTLYGPEVSYFTGKLEAVLRYMELPYTRIAKAPVGEVAEATGIAQVPALQLADGRWLTDSTPIINWLHQRYPGAGIIPQDPLLAFFSRLLEDYADEWLWRPAMHYRWDYAEGAAHVSRVLVDEAAAHIPLPGWLKRHLVRSRQRALFTRGDGVSAQTWAHVEKIYTDTLAQFDSILQVRPYLLGARPSLADFGFFGPMFRHFAMDPTSARIMRESAPSVFEWNARLWNAGYSHNSGDLLDSVPADWGPILSSIGSAYLPFLCANAQAHMAGQSHFDVDIEGAFYRNIRTAPYRVWCLQELRRHFTELSDAQQQQAQHWLERYGCWVPLWQVDRLESGIDKEGLAPFAGGAAAHSSMTGLSAGQAARRRWLPVAVPGRNG